MEWWREHGYLAGKPIGGGLWVCLAKMIFTHRLMVCDEREVHQFWCYPDKDVDVAFRAFELFDGHGDPIDGWVKHVPSERRRDPLGAVV